MTLRLRALVLVTTALISLPALAEDAKKDAADAPVAAAKTEPAKDFTIIKVGSEDIKNSEVMDVWKGLFPGTQAPDFASFDENIRQNVLRGLISERLLYQEALKAGYDKNEEVKKRLAQVEKQVIMQSFMEDKAKTLVTDDQLKAA